MTVMKKVLSSRHRSSTDVAELNSANVENKMKEMRALLLFLWGVMALTLLHAQTPVLLDLAQTGTTEQLKEAIKGGADVNARDSMDRTVLMLAAASNQNAKVISLLVAAGAKVNARGPLGWTALIMAAYSNSNPEVIEALLRAGADGKIRSWSGRTAFVYANDNPKVIASQVYASLRRAQY